MKLNNKRIIIGYLSVVLATLTININSVSALSSKFLVGTLIDTSPLPQVGTSNNEISTILNITFAILGSIALLIITIAGFSYIVSRGQPEAINKAKDTIIYALIGLVIVILADAIVNFVIGNL